MSESSERMELVSGMTRARARKRETDRQTFAPMKLDHVQHEHNLLVSVLLPSLINTTTFPGDAPEQEERKRRRIKRCLFRKHLQPVKHTKYRAIGP